MTKPRIAPYGSWQSPITSDLIVSENIGLAQIVLDGDDIYWIEVRPQEAGRNCIVRRAPNGETSDVTPTPLNARTRVHEYGGGDFVVHQETVCFSNFTDQRLYRTRPGETAAPITPPTELRYADALVDARRNRLVCVRESHIDPDNEAANSIVSLRLDNDEGDKEGGKILVSGHDFYATPRLAPDGLRLAWLAWNHPNMPWDGTELWVGEMDESGAVINQRIVAGGAEESIFQPEWSPDGKLYFVSDRTGWWNIYSLEADGNARALCPMEAEFGWPQWLFGLTTYAFISPERIICSYIERGRAHLANLDTTTGRLEPIDVPYSDITFLRANSSHAVFRGGSPVTPFSIVRLDLATGETETLRRANNLQIDSAYLSEPRAIEFPTEGGRTAHAFFYAPQNKDFSAPEGERPPLLVKSHGGPTSATTTTLRLEIQYWTSRGIAVLDVNYGGSTGYGRAYRERLNGEWGVVDVDDCANGALYLVRQGEADGERLMIDGGSAGGYTTLCALAFCDTFKAGASYFGVSDLEAMTKETHKFESRYLDRLVGPYPERADLYRERSPLHYTDRLNCPVIFFQGLEDKIVPPNQAEMMVKALRAKGLPVAYVPFEGEQHGFRRAANIKRCLDGELYFYSRVFGFELAGEVEPVPIENLSGK